MKKETILTIVVALIVGISFSSNASAQVGLRADVCFNVLSTVTKHPVTITPLAGAGAQAGADYDIHLKGSFYLTPGLYYSVHSVIDDVFYQDTRMSISTRSASLTEHSLNVPLHAKWKFDIKPDRFGLYLFLGPTMTYGMSSKLNIDNMVIFGYDKMLYQGDVVYNCHTGDLNLSDEYSNQITTMVKGTLKDMNCRYHRFEAHAELGLGFVFKRHYELALGCDFGVSNKIQGETSKKVAELWQNFYAGFRYRF